MFFFAVHYVICVYYSENIADSFYYQFSITYFTLHTTVWILNSQVHVLLTLRSFFHSLVLDSQTQNPHTHHAYAFTHIQNTYSHIHTIFCEGGFPIVDSGCRICKMTEETLLSWWYKTVKILVCHHPLLKPLSEISTVWIEKKYRGEKIDVTTLTTHGYTWK